MNYNIGMFLARIGVGLSFCLVFLFGGSSAGKITRWYAACVTFGSWNSAQQPRKRAREQQNHDNKTLEEWKPQWTVLACRLEYNNTAEFESANVFCSGKNSNIPLPPLTHFFRLFIPQQGRQKRPESVPSFPDHNQLIGLHRWSISMFYDFIQ